MKPKAVRVNVTIPEDTLRQIDATAKKRGMSRSSFLVHAARSAMRPPPLSNSPDATAPLREYAVSTPHSPSFHT